MLAGTCQFCSDTERLLKEVSELSDKLTLDIYNFVTDKEQTVYDYLCENSKDFLISFHMFGSKYCDNSNSWIKPYVWSDGILFVTGKDQASEYILDLLDITTTNDAFAIYDENMIFRKTKTV